MSRWRWIGQLALAALLIWFVGRALAGQWEAIRAADLRVRIHAGWLALSLALALATFGLQIASWRQALQGWRQRLRWRELAETWFLSNLGRYIPGKVWSVAGLVVLSARQGVEGWAATAGAVVMQAIGLGTALAVVAATLPGAATGFRVALGAGIALATVLLVAWQPVVDRLRRLVPRLEGLRPLPGPALLLSTALTVGAWVAYGLSLWALSRALGHPPVLPVGLAVGGFALAYSAGLLALFAPGGVVVREGVLVALLTPSLGAGPALTLSLASRLTLTVAELAAASPFLVSYLRRPPRAAG